jgi:hypothetical protein
MNRSLESSLSGMLLQLNEASLLDNIKCRFNIGKIYVSRPELDHSMCFVMLFFIGLTF